MSISSIKKVGMLILIESDLDAAHLFYERLGLQKQFELEGRWIEFLVGDIKLGLCATQNPPIERHTGIVFEVDDLMTFYDHVKDSIEFIQSPVAAAHGIMATIKDPGGNLIDLYQPTPQKMKDILNKMKSDKSK